MLMADLPMEEYAILRVYFIVNYVYVGDTEENDPRDGRAQNSLSKRPKPDRFDGNQFGERSIMKSIKEIVYSIGIVNDAIESNGMSQHRIDPTVL
ncbi:unnamed protein product [Dibothriocephalus latus]|uniref:Uncharacterized protein n=1 Tax=Dibothriocephalus latus TaxID=60516 RepID=A0A3P7MDM6_DIBLA|nr:unnamed protein product [Dibothriocephalus latus]